MRLTFLGTGTSQGIPVVACDCEVCRSKDEKDKRLRSSVLIETNEKIFTIDAGPDFRQQMLRCDVKYLDAVLLTHAHFDHIGGLDDVRSYNYLQKSPIDIYGNELAISGLKHTFAYAFKSSKYPGLPEFRTHIVDEKPFQVGTQTIIPIEAMHHRLPILGYRIGDLIYLTDVKKIEPKELDKIKGCKILIINALKKEEHFSHLTLREALDIVEIVQPEQTFLTHISHFMGKHAIVDAELPANVHLAYDGGVIEL
ncbi:MAG: MBL fold metallo-hydrolase [Bacteroidales bacterium]|jgi:phosphoribosyl 1,2-cyclic phosphate phosphodiesterase|nr:MBL fold metallo-hydrolase [Bacteroidales bacterium]